MNTIDKNIIQKVKDKLGVEEINEPFDLFKMLRSKLASIHPDRFTDRIAKETAENEFKDLVLLRDELSAFIQRQRAQSLPVLREENNEVAEFFHMHQMDEKDAELTELRQNLKYANINLDIARRQNEELLHKIDELSTKNINDIHEEIRTIYTPRRAWKNVGYVAIMMSLMATFPVVSKFLIQIGADSKLIMVVIQAISAVTIINWIRQVILNKIVENIEYEILNATDINNRLNVRKRHTKYNQTEFLFLESDIVSYLQSKFKNPIVSLLLMMEKNKVINALTQDVILHLDKKNVIKHTDTNGLLKVFRVDMKEITTQGTSSTKMEDNDEF